jgi:hypothetical protein
MKKLFIGLALGFLIFNAFVVDAWAQETIDFNALPVGTIVDQVFGDGGSGPIGVSGINPEAPGLNAAVIFDSANPNGDPCGGDQDFDLGTPNEDFGGPGRGAGGEAGSPFQNDTAQGNILILNEKCGLLNLVDGKVERPNDADPVGATLEFDFSAIGPVTVTSILIIDVEADETGAKVDFFNADDILIATVFLPDTGDNGVATTPFNVSGVARMEVLLNGSGAIDDIIFEQPPDCSIGDYVWEDADGNGCQDADERPIEGVEVRLFENCGDPVEIASTTTNAVGFYEFTGLDCSKEYRVQFGDAGAIYKRTLPNQSCDADPGVSDEKDSDCAQEDGFSGCITFPDPVNAPNNPTIDCGYVCAGVIGDYVWLDENEDGCQDEVNTGIAGVDVTLSEGCVDRENPKTVQTDADGFYEFTGLCPGEYFVEFINGGPNTIPGQSCDTNPDVSDEKDSNCGDEALQCVELTRDNPEDPTIDCGKVGPCLELEKRVSGDGDNFFDADNCSDPDVPFTADNAEYELIVTNCGKEAVALDRIVDPDLGINLVLDPVIPIPPGGSFEFTNDAGQTQGLLQKEGACPNTDDQFENTATVFGVGADSNLPVEATDPACVKCEEEAGCLTRTPGFWCTHDRVAELFLPVNSCGIELDNIAPSTPGSAIEDLNFSGRDFHAANTSPQQLQLIRQCTAAALNFTASAGAGGSCSGIVLSDGQTIDEVFAECCEDLCNSGASGPTISESNCIERLDEFNNLEPDTLTCETDPQAPFPFCPSLGANGFNATPATCQEANGNSFVNPGRNLGPRNEPGRRR